MILQPADALAFIKLLGLRLHS